MFAEKIRTFFGKYLIIFHCLEGGAFLVLVCIFASLLVLERTGRYRPSTDGLQNLMTQVGWWYQVDVLVFYSRRTMLVSLVLDLHGIVNLHYVASSWI